eukprot:jgi/Botrbrau1/4144/Bobra.0192s0015.2
MDVELEQRKCSLSPSLEEDTVVMHASDQQNLAPTDSSKLLGEDVQHTPAPRQETLSTAFNTTREAIPDLPISKRQRKRLAKREAIAAGKAARKEEKKAKKKQQAVERKATRAAELASLSKEVQEKLKQERRDRQKMMKEEALALKHKVQSALVDGQRIIIDMGFGTYMRDGEIRSLCKQVQYSYSYSTKTEKPAHLILTSCTDRIKARMESTCSGYNRWPISVHEQCYSKVFEGKLEDLVYLTPDSHNVVEELDPAKAYIVGGLVDRNRHKGLCYDKAVSQGVATARLPLAQHLALMGSPVLAVNHVVAILVEFQRTKDWGAALQTVVPPRKVAKRCAPDVVVPPNSVPPAKKPCHNHESMAEARIPADNQLQDC